MSNSKKAVPRHRTQSKHASNRQERAIEKRKRQEAKKEVHLLPCPSSPLHRCALCSSGADWD